jgi:hypothetical protein
VLKRSILRAFKGSSRLFTHRIYLFDPHIICIHFDGIILKRVPSPLRCPIRKGFKVEIINNTELFAVLRRIPLHDLNFIGTRKKLGNMCAGRKKQNKQNKDRGFFSHPKNLNANDSKRNTLGEAKKTDTCPACTGSQK